MLRKQYYRYTMFLPGFAVFCLFFVLPSFGSFFYGFTNLDSGFTFTRFVGFENFINLMREPDNFIAFKNTLIFAFLTTFFKVGLGLLLAIFVNLKLKTTLYLRSMLFFPVILSTIAVSLAFTAMLHPERGILNEFLRWVHMDFLAQSWLTNREIVMYSVSMVEIWKYTGLSVILFLAALQSIPKEVTESAQLDGATGWKSLRHITFPLLLPVFNTSIVLHLIGGLKVFDLIIALTGGGPGNASMVINTLIYKSFTQGRNGEATAASFILFLLVLFIVLMVNRLLPKHETER
ncbi:MAG TPA: sugar ABC transporter permease [Bacilli bacterium]